jgi:hypothetical protein
MLQSLESMPNSLPATRALEEMTKCNNKAPMHKKRGRNGRAVSSEVKNSTYNYNFDDMYQATLLIVDQPVNFPAIEWCFDDDDNSDEMEIEADRAESNTNHFTMSRFGIRKQLRSQSRTKNAFYCKHGSPCIPRCYAIPEIPKFIEYFESNNVKKKLKNMNHSTFRTSDD